MRRLPALLCTFAALLAAGVPTACAPAAFVRCNSDDDCTRRELCADGVCAAADEALAPRRALERDLAVRGELLIEVRDEEDPPSSSPEPDPAPPSEPAPEPSPEPQPEPELPEDWADPGLLRRAIVHIQGVAGVQEERVVDLPVLVRLSDEELGAAFLAAARARVLFTTVDNVPLAAELDSDRGGELFFWVKHSFDPRGSLETPERFYVYAGGDTGLAAPAPTEVWSSYFGAYHLGAARNLPQPDSAGTREGVNEGAEAETVPCTVGACLFFDGADDRMVVPSAFPELAGATQATISATVRMTAVDDAFIAVWSTPDRNRSRLFLGTDADGVPQAAVRTNDLTPGVQVAEAGPALSVGVEYRLDAVLDMVAGTIALFVNGQLRATDTFASAGALPNTPSAEAAVGAASGTAQVDEFDGRVDEVRISARKRSPDFVRVDAAARAGALTIVTLDR